MSFGRRGVRRLLDRARETIRVVTGSRSYLVTDSDIIERFVEDPDATFLVSFPRTGSHWLRMVMERYFETPSLLRVFYYRDAQRFLTLHTHDSDLGVERRRVIYLLRDPIPTIYSQMVYQRDDLTDPRRVAYWALRYGAHLSKWLIEERFTDRKTVVRYERLRTDPVSEFERVALHFDRPLDIPRLAKATRTVTKREVRRKTPHDRKVLVEGDVYEDGRRAFADRYGGLVEETIRRRYPRVAEDVIGTGSEADTGSADDAPTSAAGPREMA